MNIDILDRGGFGSAVVHLEPGEEFVSESGAMYLASANIDIDVTTRARSRGGLLGGVKRLLAAEHFFFSTYRVRDQAPGVVGLAPTLQGEVRLVEADGRAGWLCAGGSYLGSTRDISVADSSHERLFKSEAMAAVAQWRFEPRIFMDRAIDQRAHTRIRFNFNN